MAGFQCAKLLYFQVHRNHWARANTLNEQLLFDQGHLVGAEARKRFAGGELVMAPAWEYDQAIRGTKNAMEKGAPAIFEAAFQNGPLYVRVDILERVPEGWNIIEVKSSVSVKEDSLVDCTIQYAVLKGLGIDVQRVKLMYINKACVAPNLENLFSVADVTDEVKTRSASVKTSIKDFLEAIRKDQPPEIQAGTHCTSPYECRFQKKCWTDMLMPPLSILNIPGLKNDQKWEIFHRGEALEDLNTEDFPEVSKRAIDVYKTDQPFIAREKLLTELKEWQWPLWFLDFETIGFAVPRFDGTHPYQQVPFQFSLHMQSEVGGPVRQEEFLDTSGADPRESLILKMLDSIGDEGDIVAYYAEFEKRVIADLALAYPQYAERLQKLLPRFRDPLPLIRSHIYLKEFNGSFSIKSVGPALLGNEFSYENLRVRDGAMAQAAYLECLKDKGDGEEIRGALREYCGQDTFILVKLVERLMTI